MNYYQGQCLQKGFTTNQTRAEIHILSKRFTRKITDEMFLTPPLSKKRGEILMQSKWGEFKSASQLTQALSSKREGGLKILLLEHSLKHIINHKKHYQIYP